MKHDTSLDPKEVLAMPLAKFERLYGFRPVDALEKQWFATTGKRLPLDALGRVFIRVADSVPDLSGVVME